MARVKRGTIKNAHHKKWLSLAKGYQGRSGTCYTIARNRVEKGLQHAYRDRKLKKRTMRSLWIMRLNAALRNLGYKFSTFMGKYNQTLDSALLNVKMLSECAIRTPSAFKTIVNNIMQ